MRTFLVPRALQAYLARMVFVLVRRVLWLRSSHRHSYEQRDRVMAFYAPLALLALLITYLPSLYAAFQRREAGVAKLEVRAGDRRPACT